MKFAYYNEIDLYCAEWLRNLIKAGYIPDGEVDTRSIEDVCGDDLKEYGQCHFFAGIGGWPYAARLAGISDDEPIWTGSCPCQPLSSAGQRKGHADERHLWPAFHALIAERRPAKVFGEQVASRLGREWLAGVRADLEHLGYAVGAADLPAAGLGAPHIRQRLWWMANSTSTNDNDTSIWKAKPDNDGTDDDSGESKWPVEPDVDRVAHGIPSRVDKMCAYGNAIVPQVAAEFIRASRDVV